MKAKIEAQLLEIANQIDQANQDYIDKVHALNAQQVLLEQALLYATDVPPDVQVILDAAV